MPAGFYSETDQGVTQIDAHYKNIARVGHVAIPSAQWTQVVVAGFGMGTYYETTVSLAEGMIFVGDTSGSAVAIQSTAPGDLGRRNVRLAMSAPKDLDVYAYAQTEPSLDRYGLQVFDAAGEIVFNSTDEHLRIIELREAPPMTSGMGWLPHPIQIGDYGQDGIIAMLAQHHIWVQQIVNQTRFGFRVFQRAIAVNSEQNEVISGQVFIGGVPPVANTPIGNPFEPTHKSQVVVAGLY